MKVIAQNIRGKQKKASQGVSLKAVSGALLLLYGMSALAGAAMVSLAPVRGFQFAFGFLCITALMILGGSALLWRNI